MVRSLFHKLRATWQTARDTAFHPVDPASLVVFRVVIGLLLFAATVRFWQNGWIESHYITPKFFFKYYGFEWVKPWPGNGMYIHFAVMAAAALGITFGLFYRASSAAFCLLFTYAHLIDKTHYLNHYYFVSLLTALLVVTPLHHTTSLDRLWGFVKPTAFIPRWALWLLRFQVGTVYFFAGVAKLNSDWLFHAQPLTIWLGANTDFPIIGSLFRYKVSAFFMSWAGAAFDLTIVFFLLWQRSQKVAYAAVVVFHGITGALFPIGMFPWIMTSAALIFFPPNWPVRLLPASWQTRFLPVANLTFQTAPRAPFSPLWHRLGVALFACYAAFQVFLPVRHWLYPGTVGWTEQGFRFSWKVMLVEKNGDVEITALDPDSGRKWKVDLREHLYPYQVKQMSTQPDMILEFCRFVAETFRSRGVRNVQVHASVFVAYNGRKAAPLIDPTVDLGTVADGLGPYAFVLPAPFTPIFHEDSTRAGL